MNLSRATKLRSPMPVPFYYGWVIVAIIVAAGLVGSGVDSVAFGVVFKPMSEDLGWSRSVVSGAVALGTVLAGLATPFLGALADRVGPRLLIAGGAGISGALVLAMAFAVEPWQFYVTYVPAKAVATTTLFGVVSLTAVTNWFQTKRPRAIGIVSMAIPVGAAAMAQLYQITLTTLSWRGSFVILALLLFLVALPAFFLLRRQPEDVGLLPDGATVNGGSRGSSSLGDEQSWSPKEALHTAVFWLIIGSFMLAAFSIGTLGFHLVAYFTDIGIESGTAVSILSVFALSGGAAILLWGFVAERINVRYLAVLNMLFSAMAVVLLLNVSSPVTGFGFAVLYGFTARSQSTLVQIMLAEYFGRRFFGSISGVTIGFQLCVMGISPWIAALVFDVTGSYQNIFTVFIVLYALSAVFMFFARKPRPPVLANSHSPH